ncbi:hypothetical protein JCM30237_29560 [Halolamina litorea]|uniref:PEP-CTERM protein-sorting domain-containing protein n=1 Tax=Halolamina litorea TaxID=1515593 RepID=A0ABD6BT13_9EURY|nr:hypothetical protein [Halolamina litorea]
MARFESPAVAVAYFLFAGMGVVALLVTAGQVSEAAVQRVVLPPVLLALVAVAGWEYRRRRRGDGGDEGDDDA